MWTAYALNNMGMGVNSLQEAYSELARYIDILVRDVELYLHREGWSDCTREKKRLKVLRCFLSAVYDVIEEEETNGPSLTVGRAQSLLEEMKLYSFLRPCMDILMDHMYHKDVKDIVEYVSIIMPSYVHVSLYISPISSYRCTQN